MTRRVNGQVLSSGIDPASVAFYDAAPGSLYRPAPASPSAFDDEFLLEGGADPLQNGWTLWDERSLLTAPFVDADGLNLVLETGGNVGCQGIYRDAPAAGDFTVHAYLSATMVDLTGCGVALWVGEQITGSEQSATGFCLTLCKFGGELRMYRGNGVGFATSTPPGSTSVNVDGSIWARIRVDRGTAMHAEVSNDGVTWVSAGSVANTQTIGSMGLVALGPSAGSATNIVHGRARAFRVVESFLALDDKLPSSVLKAAA